ncbi:MAG TPA: hypothetical protein VMG37_08865, partial [Solirubrobacteraceae bacterium]|nr:hypothetical protein [Solirubrobacteraceae bacterium]
MTAWLDHIEGSARFAALLRAGATGLTERSPPGRATGSHEFFCIRGAWRRSAPSDALTRGPVACGLQ